MQEAILAEVWPSAPMDPLRTAIRQWPACSPNSDRAPDRQASPRQLPWQGSSGRQGERLPPVRLDPDGGDDREHGVIATIRSLLSRDAT